MQRLSALSSVDAAARLEFIRRLFQVTATIAKLGRTKMNPRISLNNLVARLESADHTIAYFNKPLPEPLLDGLRLLAGRRGRGSVDLVVERIDDVAYLKKLNFAGALVTSIQRRRSASGNLGHSRSNSRLLVSHRHRCGRRRSGGGR
jgi:hypothetical protein